MKVAQLIDDVIRDLDKALEHLQLGGRDTASEKIGQAIRKLKDVQWDYSKRQ